MARKIVSLLLAVCLLIFSIPLAASAEESDGWRVVRCGEESYLMYRVMGTGDKYIEISRPPEQWETMDVANDLIIPDTIEGLPVREIGPAAFMGCNTLTSVVLPDGLLAVGDGAFTACQGLKSINLPASVETVGPGAFRDVPCPVSVDAGNGHFVLENNAFLCSLDDGGEKTLLHCPLKDGEIAIPEGITALEGEAFADDTACTSLSFPATLKTIGPNFFGHLTAGKYLVPSSNPYYYTSETGALYNAGKTVLMRYPVGKEEFDIEPTVTEFGPTAFFQCSFPKADLSSLRVKRLPSGVFSASAIEKIQLPTGLTEIDDSAFAFCSKLKSLSIPEGVTALNFDTFAGCSALTSLSIPSGLVEGIENAFNRSPNLLITVDERNPRYASIGNVLYEKSGSDPVTVLHAADGPAELVLPETVTTITTQAFYGNTSLTSITLPEALLTIEDMAFSGCSGLQELRIPKQVTDLANPFGGDGDWTSSCALVVDEGNSSYFSFDGALYGSDGTLMYAPDKSSLSFPEDRIVTKIGRYVFRNNQLLERITLPDTVKEIGEGAFYCCQKLTSVQLPEGLTRISRLAFAGMPWLPSPLTDITLPQSLSYIGTQAFQNCTALKKVSVTAAAPEAQLLRAAGDEKLLDSAVFSNCQMLETVEIPAGITTIGANAFENCPKLKSIVIPSQVTSIDSDAFAGITGLTFYGTAGSYAEDFANANGIPFREGTPPVTPPSTNPGTPTTPDPEEPAAPFTDIKGHWGEDAIVWAYGQKLFAGVTDTLFVPDGQMNRGMMVAVLYRLAGSPEPKGENPFADVTETDYFAPAAAWAAENRIAAGVGENRLDPASNITREQLAAMLYRYAKPETAGTGDLSKFTDGGSVHSWALDAVTWAVGEDVLSGKGNGILDPQGNATRAEVASMLMRFAAD